MPYDPVNNLYAILEHKQCMLIRLQILAQNAIQKKDELDRLAFRYEHEMCYAARILLNLLLKYTLTKRNDARRRLPDLVMKLKKFEMALLCEFMDSFEL